MCLLLSFINPPVTTIRFSTALKMFSEIFDNDSNKNDEDIFF